MTSDQRTRLEIKRQLHALGWVVQQYGQVNRHAALGVAPHHRWSGPPQERSSGRPASDRGVAQRAAVEPCTADDVAGCAWLERAGQQHVSISIWKCICSIKAKATAYKSL